MRVYVYIMAASRDPDVCERSVPFAIDEREVFFGPCKKRLRSELRRRFLRNGAVSAVPDEETYLVGLNGGNRRKVRKVLWAGRIKNVMTFERAYDTLTAGRYTLMREHPATPMHLAPLREEGRLVGYEHVGKLHDGDWILDIAGRRTSSRYEVNGKKVRLARGVSAAKGFARDACMVLSNIFTATRFGISIDERMLALFRDVPDLRGRAIDTYAVFGYQADGDVQGRRGRWLLLQGPAAVRFIEIVEREAEALKSKQGPIEELEAGGGCRCDPGEREEDDEEEGEAVC